MNGINSQTDIKNVIWLTDIITTKQSKQSHGKPNNMHFLYKCTFNYLKVKTPQVV